MTKAKAQPAPAPVETAPVVAASVPLEGDPTAPAPTDMTGLPSALVAPAPEPTSIHLRTTHGTDLVNPYTTQKITTAGVEVVRLDGWLDFQIESGKIARYTPEAAAE